MFSNFLSSSCGASNWKGNTTCIFVLDFFHFKVKYYSEYLFISYYTNMREKDAKECCTYLLYVKKGCCHFIRYVTYTVKYNDFTNH